MFGVGSTLTSFIVLGNYSMGLQMTDKADFIAKYLENGDMYGMIVDMIKTMPGAPVVDYDDRLLCNILRLYRTDGILLQLPHPQG